MSHIKAEIGGKAKGLADRVTIDPAIGCKNRCVGCYGKKASQRGKHYDNVRDKEFNKEVFEKSIRLAKKKGFHFARIGKHCDPGDHIDSLYGILDCCNTQNFRCVVVSKSLEYNDRIAELLRTGKHKLHMSLGPWSPIAPSEENRLRVASAYISRGVDTSIRLTRDITREMNRIDKRVAAFMECILTPMRYASKKLLSDNGAQIQNFEYADGYYRPLIIHDDWRPMVNVCGEIGGHVYCCNCLIKED